MSRLRIELVEVHLYTKTLKQLAAPSLQQSLLQFSMLAAVPMKRELGRLEISEPVGYFRSSAHLPIGGVLSGAHESAQCFVVVSVSLPGGMSFHGTHLFTPTTELATHNIVFRDLREENSATVTCSLV